MKKLKTAIIIGAGPAGLTAAYELATRTDIRPIILEKGNYVGGIAATLSYKGNKLDIGGHRFFTKSDRVLQWWLSFLPLERTGKTTTISYQNNTHQFVNKESSSTGNRMLIRKRKSRIYYEKNFFTYPLSFDISTVQKLGFHRCSKILIDYIHSSFFPRKPELTLEDFLINRFGHTLYSTFFKTYTEKVWGKECSELEAEWGYQRIKGLSLVKTLMNTIKKQSYFTTNTEATLSEYFMYPSKGPGELWEVVTKKALKNGACLKLDHSVDKIYTRNNKVYKVVALHKNKEVVFHADYVISTMAITDLANAFVPNVPVNISKAASNLAYRAFIVVGLLIPKSAFTQKIKDNWIYIHDQNVKVGRIQIFNNWSPKLVKDKSYYWIGMEYFCDYNDTIWNLSNDNHKELAIDELKKIGMIKSAIKPEGTVIRIDKAYPTYSNSYKKIHILRKYFDRYENLFLVGRNGMHRYNNQDHSGLAAMIAVDLIISRKKSKEVLWNVNTELDHHEKS